MRFVTFLVDSFLSVVPTFLVLSVGLVIDSSEIVVILARVEDGSVVVVFVAVVAVVKSVLFVRFLVDRFLRVIPTSLVLSVGLVVVSSEFVFLLARVEDGSVVAAFVVAVVNVVITLVVAAAAAAVVVIALVVVFGSSIHEKCWLDEVISE